MQLSPPLPSFASRQLTRLLPAGSQSRWISWTVALALATGCVAVEFVAPPAFSIILFQLLLTAYASASLGVVGGSSLALATIIAGALIDHLFGVPRTPGWIELWNLTARLCSAGMLAFVLAGHRRCIELEQWRATTDQLTGAANRRAFEEGLHETLRRAAKVDETLVLVYVDLDGFKAVNDRFGHAAGNHVLIAFAAGARRAIRAEDLFARIGGDEFVALLVVGDVPEGDAIVQLLHRRLSEVLASTGFAVTCSSGALVMPASVMAGRDGLLEYTDGLMYLAKQSGKNMLYIGHGETLDAAARGRRERQEVWYEASS